MYYYGVLRFVMKNGEVLEYDVEDVVKTYDELAVLKMMWGNVKYHGVYGDRTHGLIFMAPKRVRLKYEGLIDEVKAMLRTLDLNDTLSVSRLDPKARECVNEYLAWRGKPSELKKLYECGSLLLYRMLRARVVMSPFRELQAFLESPLNVYNKHPSILRMALCQAFRCASDNNRGELGFVNPTHEFAHVNKKKTMYYTPSKYYIATEAMIESLKHFMYDFGRYYKATVVLDGCTLRVRLPESLFPPSILPKQYMRLTRKCLRRHWFTNYFSPLCAQRNVVMIPQYYTRYKCAIHACFLNYSYLGQHPEWLLLRRKEPHPHDIKRQKIDIDLTK